MALNLEQAGGVVGAVAVPIVGQEFADPFEERVELADDRREFGIGGNALLGGRDLLGGHGPSLLQMCNEDHPDRALIEIPYAPMPQIPPSGGGATGSVAGCSGELTCAATKGTSSTSSHTAPSRRTAP